MSVNFHLAEFAHLVYGNKAALTEAVLQDIRNLLRKDLVESIADARTISMALDHQTFPTPLVVRFSAEDIAFFSINGIECPVDRGDRSVSVPSALSGEYEPHIAAALRKLCCPGSVVFDVGANVGFHSMLLSRLVGDNGQVLAFEPSSENCRLILLAAEHNRVSNLKLLPIALSDQRGWAYFSSHIGSNGGFVSEQFVTLQGHGTVVPTFTMDELSLPSVDLIKIDVEGAEYRALKGGARLISQCRPTIVCEFSQEMTSRVSGIEPAEFLNWIASLDYDIFIIDRQSCVVVRQDSVAGLMNEWGHWGRIEDLLFLPREKGDLASALAS